MVMLADLGMKNCPEFQIPVSAHFLGYQKVMLEYSSGSKSVEELAKKLGLSSDRTPIEAVGRLTLLKEGDLSLLVRNVKFRLWLRQTELERLVKDFGLKPDIWAGESVNVILGLSGSSISIYVEYLRGS